jgi:MerR family transcriptional regulator, light-induced transcriptional regulator
MDDQEQGARHPIGVVAERTGLSQEVLRVWERRYGAVRPIRAEGGQRLYTDEDVERLRLLRRATQGGRNIGGVAGLPMAELTRLVREDEEAGTRRSGNGAGAALVPVDLEPALARVRALDGDALEAQLRRMAAVLGAAHFLEQVVAPFMRRVGEEWHGGRISPAHEHLATAAVQRVVMGVLGSLGESEDAPVFVAAAPSGERHEIGALLAAAAAASEGWRVVYLGADLPAEDIAAAAVSTGARAVGVSVVFAEDRQNVAAEIRSLRERLPASVPLLVGGMASAALARDTGDADVIYITDLEALRASLRRWKAAG